MPEAFLEVTDLKTHFPIEKGFLFKKQVGTVKAVDGIDLTLAKGEVLGLVGESGCGKSTLGRTILQLIPPTAGSVVLAGRNLAGLKGEALRDARGDFQMIFQDPYASLNPRMTVYDTLAEAIGAHKEVSSRDMPGKVSELLQRVGLSPRFIRKYPHEFSGGQRQRIAIARALAVEPQAHRRRRTRQRARRVHPGADHQPAHPADARDGPDDDLHLARPERGQTHLGPHRRHVPRAHRGNRAGGGGVRDGRCIRTRRRSSARCRSPIPTREKHRQRIILSGDPPSPINPPAGCTFHPRCPYMVEACKAAYPPFVEYTPERRATCIRLHEINPPPGQA